jgi:hypothetical protein
MSWRHPFQAILQGAAITLGSTVISCGLAIQVEASAHRLLFWCAPEKYANVEQAYGLDQSQLDSVKHLGNKHLETRLQIDKERVEPLSPSTYSQDSVFPEVHFAADQKVSYLTTIAASTPPRSKSAFETTTWLAQPNDDDERACARSQVVPGTNEIVRQELSSCAMTA